MVKTFFWTLFKLSKTREPEPRSLKVSRNKAMRLSRKSVGSMPRRCIPRALLSSTPRKINGRSLRIPRRKRNFCVRWRKYRTITGHCVILSLVCPRSDCVPLELALTLTFFTGNYRSCTLDCAAVLKLNPKNVKAYYRSSMALLKLDKVAEAEDAASRGLTIDPSNKALQTAASKIADRKAQVERVAAKRKAEEDLARKQNLVLSTALRARQIRTRKTDQPPDMEDTRIRLVPDPLSPESSVEFPAVFLYPMDAQSDFIKGFSELHSIVDHLDYIFPLPWDTKKEYTINNVECFMQTVTGGLIKAGKKLPLLQILSGGKVEVVDELVKIFVVPISKTGAFIAEMKARKEG